MTPLENAQAALLARIVTDEYFDEAWCFSDDGLRDDEIETALTTHGIAVVVSPPVDADLDGAFPAKICHGAVTFGVEIWVNEGVNKERATPRVISEAVSRAVAAIVSGNDTPGRAGWAAHSFAIVNTDPGLAAYVVLVQTRVVFSAAP